MYINQWFASDLPGSNLLISKCYLNVSKPQFQISMRGKINKLIEKRQMKVHMKPYLLLKTWPLSHRTPYHLPEHSHFLKWGDSGAGSHSSCLLWGFLLQGIVQNASVQLCGTLLVSGLQQTGLCLWSMLGNTFSHFNILNSQRILVPCLMFYLLLLLNEVLKLIGKMSWIFCFLSLGNSTECQRMYQPLLSCPNVIMELLRCTLEF